MIEGEVIEWESEQSSHLQRRKKKKKKHAGWRSNGILYAVYVRDGM